MESSSPVVVADVEGAVAALSIETEQQPEPVQQREEAAQQQEEKAAEVEVQAEQPKKFLKVDIHTHILPKHWPDLKKKYGYGGWISLDHYEPGKARMMMDGKPFRDISCNCWSPDARLRECNGTGVDVQVLSTVPVMFAYSAKPEDTLDLARYLNDHIAQTVAENPKRFIGLGTLPMQSPQLAVQELHRCVKDLGLAGVQIGSHVNEWNLDAPELDPIYTAAEELGAAIFIHPWDMPMKGRMAPYWFPWLIGMPCETTMAICSLIFGGVLEAHPKLRIGFAHGGGSFLATFGRIRHGWEVRPDLCATRCKRDPMEYLHRIYIDSLVHDPDVIHFMKRKLPLKNIMLGSDYPFPLGEDHPGKMVEEMTDLTDEEKAGILGKNALAFLGLDEKEFAK